MNDSDLVAVDEILELCVPGDLDGAFRLHTDRPRVPGEMWMGHAGYVPVPTGSSKFQRIWWVKSEQGARFHDPGKDNQEI